jgi:hypothetical protein
VLVLSGRARGRAVLRSPHAMCVCARVEGRVCGRAGARVACLPPFPPSRHPAPPSSALNSSSSLTPGPGAAAVASPFSLDVEFKKPTLLPNKLTLTATPAGQDYKAAAASPGGYALRVDDKKGKPLLVAAARSSAARV